MNELPVTHMSYGAKQPDRPCCPKCGRPTGYLMQTDRNREWPPWAWTAIAALVTLGTVATLVVFR